MSQLQTVTKISTRNFFITRHTCYRCIYLLIVIIITVLWLFLRYTITPFIETDSITLFSHYLVVVLIGQQWYNLQTRIYNICEVSVQFFFCSINSRARFSLIFSYLLKTFLFRVVGTSQKSAFFMNKISSLIVSTTTLTIVSI